VYRVRRVAVRREVRSAAAVVILSRYFWYGLCLRVCDEITETLD
jgi:hypothetical protein